jgi:hypothetical protein
MTRLFRQPQQIAVKTNDLGEPVAIYRASRRDRVISISRRWRVNESWWRQQVSREYFQIETARGLVAEVYRDMLSNSWYLHRVYD